MGQLVSKNLNQGVKTGIYYYVKCLQKSDASSSLESFRILFSFSCTDYHDLFIGSPRNGAARILTITLPIVAAILASVVIFLCLWWKKSKPARKTSVSCRSFSLVPYLSIILHNCFYKSIILHRYNKCFIWH